MRYTTGNPKFNLTIATSTNNIYFMIVWSTKKILYTMSLHFYLIILNILHNTFHLLNSLRIQEKRLDRFVWCLTM